MSATTPGKTDFKTALTLFQNSNRDRVKLSAERGGRYVVLHREAEASTVQLEVSAGRQLPKELRWTPEQAQGLYDMGLRQGRASRNFAARLSIEAMDSEVVQKLLAIADGWLDTRESDPAWHVFEGSCLNLETRGLEEAMNHLARQRTWQARTGLYSVLLASRLLVPVEDEGTGLKTRFKAVDKVGTRPVVAAFSSYENLDRHAPLGCKAVALPGDVLFPELLSGGVGILRLDTGSAPSGELYANEFQILVDGLKRMRGSH